MTITRRELRDVVRRLKRFCLILDHEDFRPETWSSGRGICDVERPDVVARSFRHVRSMWIAVRTLERRDPDPIFDDETTAIIEALHALLGSENLLPDSHSTFALGVESVPRHELRIVEALRDHAWRAQRGFRERLARLRSAVELLEQKLAARPQRSAETRSRPLKPSEVECLEALQSLGATSFKKLVAAKQVAKAIHGVADRDRVKEQLANLKRLELVHGKQGTSGGYWITREGLARLERETADHAEEKRQS